MNPFGRAGPIEKSNAPPLLLSNQSTEESVISGLCKTTTALTMCEIWLSSVRWLLRTGGGALLISMGPGPTKGVHRPAPPKGPTEKSVISALCKTTTAPRMCKIWLSSVRWLLRTWGGALLLLHPVHAQRKFSRGGFPILWPVGNQNFSYKGSNWIHRRQLKYCKVSRDRYCMKRSTLPSSCH